MAEPQFLTLEESARVAGHARWVETRLFEVLGSWVHAEHDAAVKTLWAVRSRRHADHAAGWHDRQPRVAHLHADVLTVAANAGAAALLEALARTAGADDTDLRLTAVARVVLPALVGAYRSRLARAHPLADGPTVRWSSLVVADEEEARMRVEELLASRQDGGGEARRSHQSRLQALISGTTGLLGLPDRLRCGMM